jgi:P-type E1-E2 ATPase
MLKIYDINMKEVNIPKLGTIKIKNIIFDMNGTIQFKGQVSDEIVKKFNELKKHFNVYLVSSDTRGNLSAIAQKLGVEYIKIAPANITDAEEKNNVLLKLGKEQTIAVGNGNNDALMLKNALLGIAIIGNEGASSKSILNSNVVFTDPLSAIDFLLDEKIMIATLRS